MKLKMMMIGLLGLGIAGAPAFADQAPARTARPGTINYVEGAVSVQGQPLDSKDAGNATLEQGQDLSTANGKAEILLTPGVFLRVDSNSTVKMVNPDLTLTQVEVEKGRAGVEVDEIHDQNDLQVIDAGVTTRLDKKGYYEFDANHPQAMVFKGMAKTEVADGKWREIKSHHELMLNGGTSESLAKEKPADFDTNQPDDLYKWSSLRSKYLAEANNQIAAEYAGAYAPGWYWNPYGWGYTFIGAGPFFSPFGWGFYPFGYGGWYGGWGGWYGAPGWYGHGRYYRYGDFHGNHGAVRAPSASGFRSQGGFRAGGMSGFHGSMGGGFHGGVAHGR